MDLFDEVLDFIRKPHPERFEKLALKVFAYQCEHVAAYRDFCEQRGLTPASTGVLNEVPLVSTAAFKYLSLGDVAAERVFITSGTTRGKDTRGRHFVPKVELYRTSALAHLQRMLFADGRRTAMLSLHPSAAILPHSSLAQMIDWLIEEFGAGPAAYCADERTVDFATATAFLRAAQETTQAVCLLGTTAAFAALFRIVARDRPIRLAAGSRLMDTGGAKGQTVALSAAEVVAMAENYLGIAPEMVINEYGMTELCSQLYDVTGFNCPTTAAGDGPRRKLAPPWLRVVARDPRTLAPLPAEQPGLLSFFDLANLGSVSAILTEDLGTVREDGSVLVHGRAYAAQPRGCALSIEEFAVAPADHGITLAPVAAPVAPATTAREIVAVARRMRELPPALDRLSTARALADLFSQWRQPDYSIRRRALDATCALNGINRDLLEASLDALLRNFTFENLLALAERHSRAGLLVGFIMPGNVTGAGLHEFVQTLIAGGCALIKPASADPYFFPALAHSLRALDSRLGARLAVLNWSRAEQAATGALGGACDLVVGFGDNSTIAQLGALMGDKLIDFGARMSIALIAREVTLDDELAQALARDVTLFEQRGCLSLHQLFLEGADSEQACLLARKIARALAHLAQRWPNGPSNLGDTALARAVTSDAYWRMAGGQGVRVWSAEDQLDWSVICDPGAQLGASPLGRTLRIATAADLDELQSRLPIGELGVEAVATADPAGRLKPLEPHLRKLGASYFCPPGQLQSPSPSWPHGGGRLLNHLLQS